MGFSELRKLDLLDAATPQLVPQDLRSAWSGHMQRSKFRRPEWPAGALVRPRLLARMDEGDAFLTLLVAPSGFGKTHAAMQWAQRDPAAAWLTIDVSDASFPRFWAHLREALQTVAPGYGELVNAAFRMPSRASARDLGRMLADELLDALSPIHMVIDDLHLVPTGEVHDFLAGLIEVAPPALRLVITSRMESPLPLPLTQLRLRGVVGDIRGEDLLFTAAETLQHLDRVFSGALGSKEELAGTLWRQTGGWPVGVRLGTLALARVDGGMDTVLAETRHAGSRLIAIMLEEILAERSPQERLALQRAALPEAFTVSLVEALIGVGEAGPARAAPAAIQFALDADLCRPSAEAGKDWLTFHPLFRDALRARLVQQEPPETVSALHACAAAWCAAVGRAGAAIPHWIAAGQVEAAVALVERETPAAFARDNWWEVANWLELLPADVVNDRPELLLASAWVAQLRGQGMLLRNRLSLLDALMSRDVVAAGRRDEVRAEMDLLQLVLLAPLQVDPAGAVEIARRVTAHIPSTRRYRLGVAWAVLGAALQAAGRGAEAVEDLTAWSELAPTQGDAGSARGLLGLLFVHAQAGELARVESVGRFMQEAAERQQLRLTLGWAHRFLGDACYERNDLSGAITHYSAVARDAEHMHLVGLREAFFGLARAALASGQVGEARRAMRRCREVITQAGAVEHLPVIDACEAFLTMRTGERHQAFAWASAHQPGVDETSLHLLGHPAVLRAAILAAGDEGERMTALNLIAELRTRASSAHFESLLVRLDALAAVAHMRCGEREAAFVAMRSSLKIGGPQGFVRTYLDLLPEFTPELRALAADREVPPAVRMALADAITQDGPEPRANPANPLIPLTRREREVLAALAQRLSYQEIAERLFISPFTVKRHAAGIYGKLGASGRLEAIHLAEELGWLP